MRPECCSQHLKDCQEHNITDRCSICCRINTFEPSKRHLDMQEPAGLTFWLLMLEICITQIYAARARKAPVVSCNREKSSRYNGRKLRILTINLTLSMWHMCHTGLMNIHTHEVCFIYHHFNPVL